MGGNNKGTRRQFGAVRPLSSGRYQARYRGPDGIERPADRTFATQKEAARWLTLKEAEIARQEWIDPDAGTIRFGDYAAGWLEQRELSPKTEQLYEGLLRIHLKPTFDHMSIKDIREAHVRKWRTARRKSKVGKTTVAKAYRLMRAILNTAVRDELIRKNPCQIEGAGVESSDERPVLSVAEVFKVADAINPRYRALVLLATFGSLRWGELAGLRRRYLDLDDRTVTIRETVYDLAHLVPGTPKSKAGYRTVVLPSLIIDDLKRHLGRFAAPGEDGFVFVGARGNPLRRANFSKYWADACEKAGVKDVHFHDLRHTGNTYAAEAGASLRELMNRMGHSSPRAAMVYLHARENRARDIADALGERAADELKRSWTDTLDAADGDDDDDEDPPTVGARV
ncbi:tyrosine-type recombinase/integrase [Nocardiopsis sp. RSe5-2]|uniref:Tyrosine-type recombinase/integrase n=1 Tax=Nocardiopsis endophytica TaxID=3018445 RepID=A0ABT4TWI6_9ACTN|nr:tyrosine-type recombinase/integrase [Nocardiopsis endophytica]MDA2809057.1 tyrosine-type recombinase/integrase [Nocardiopsis endophytica]